MSTFKNIINGYGNLLKNTVGLSSEEEEELFEARANVCKICEFRVKLTNSCGKCGCYIPGKTKCLKCSCPEGYW